MNIYIHSYDNPDNCIGTRVNPRDAMQVQVDHLVDNDQDLKNTEVHILTFSDPSP